MTNLKGLVSRSSDMAAIVFRGFEWRVVGIAWRFNWEKSSEAVVQEFRSSASSEG